MSFFAGKIAGGQNIVSLRRDSGGDKNNHVDPSDQTIFHSKMPHVLILETYEADLQGRDNDYWTCRMPDRVRDLLANDFNRVVLTEVEFVLSNGVVCRRLLMGGATAVGSITWQDVANSTVIIGGHPSFIHLLYGAFGANIVATNDVACDHGFFNEGTGGDTVSKKLIDGTGRKFSFSCFSDNMGIGTLGGAGSFYDKKDNAIYPSNPNDVMNFDPNGYLIPPSGCGRGFDSFFIKSKRPRLEAYYRCRANSGGLIFPSGVNLNAFYKRFQISGADGEGGYGAYMGPCEFSFTDQQFNSNLNDKGMLEDPYLEGISGFRKVRWYVTNMRYTGNGFEFFGSPFNNYGDLKISKNEFRVGGVNLMDPNGPRFINMVNAGQSQNRPDMWPTAANLYRWNNDADWPKAGLPYCGVPTDYYGTGVWGGESTDWGVGTLNIYRFQPSAQWYVDTRRNAIGNQWGDVWSPDNVPLRSLGGAASAQIGGESFQVSGGANQVLANMNLGMNIARNGAVVMTIDFIDSSWFFAAGRGMYCPVYFSGGADSRLRIANLGNGGSAHIRHQILCLPVNQYVPFFVSRGLSVVNAGRGQNQSSSFYSVIYYMRNVGDGNLEISVRSSGSVSASVAGQNPNEQSKTMNNVMRLPNMKIVVQRLN